VKEETVGKKKAIQLFNAPRRTMRRKVEGNCISATFYEIQFQQAGSPPPLHTHTHTHTHKKKRRTENHVLRMRVSHYGLTTKNVRFLVFQLVESNKLKHRFSKQKKLAEEDCLQGFLCRHPDLS
jgi:hypothetical protein